MKASDNPFPKVRFAEQLADPASPPPAGSVYVFLRDDGLWYQMDELGAVSLWGGTGGGGGGINSFEITEMNPPTDRRVHCTGGYIIVDTEVSGTIRKTLIEVAEQDSGLIVLAAPATNPRIDIIGVDVDGFLFGVNGTQSATPAIPSITNNYQHPLYLVYQRVGSTAIRTEDNGVDSFLIDIRHAPQSSPFLIDGSGSVSLTNAINQIRGPYRNGGTASSYIQFSSNGFVVSTANVASGGDIYLLVPASGAKQRMSGGDGVVFPSLSAAPATGENGQVYYDTTTNKLRVYANGSWVDLH